VCNAPFYDPIFFKCDMVQGSEFLQDAKMKFVQVLEGFVSGETTCSKNKEKINHTLRILMSFKGKELGKSQ